MDKCAYGGKILRINLNNLTYEIEPLNYSWFKDVIGGRAANSKRLFEELDPGCDPLGPDNLLLFGTGPLTGTILPASAYYTISAKSPLTGILGDSAAGGQFAAEMKQTGFDQIIISGQAEKLLYLLITSDGVQFINCPYMSNYTIIETTLKIRAENRDHGIEVAAIGPAGENRVLFAAVVSSGNRVNGRTGMGAVMGSKNLKAVAVKGSIPVHLADPLLFLEETTKMSRAIQTHNEYNKRHQLGTTMLMNDLNRIGILPTRHFQEGVCQYVDQISGERLATLYKVKNKSCFNCHVHCSRYYVCNKTEAEGPEFETLCGFTSRIGIDDLSFALEMNEYLNQMGLDSLGTCEVIGWLMEAFEKGLIHPQDLDGISLSWGNTQTVRQLVNLIVFRRGIGDQLANGATQFSKQFPKPAQDLVMQVKGLDIICGDPRGIKAYGLTYAIASRGADHLRAEPYFELTGQRELAKARFGTALAADRLAEDGKAALVTYSERIALLTDCLTMCKNIGLCMDIINFQNASILLSSGTGIKYDPDYLVEIMAESVKREYELNKKFGVTPEQDTLPDRFLHEPLKTGPTKGATVNIKKMVDEYYKLHK